MEIKFHTVNANQHHVDRHLLDENPINMDVHRQNRPMPSTCAQINNVAGISEDLNSIVLGNHMECKGVNIFPHYINSSESYDEKTTNMSTYIYSTSANLQKNQRPRQGASALGSVQYEESI